VGTGRRLKSGQVPDNICDLSRSTPIFGRNCVVILYLRPDLKKPLTHDAINTPFCMCPCRTQCLCYKQKGSVPSKGRCEQERPSQGQRRTGVRPPFLRL